MLPDDDLFVGWGQQPYFTEFNSSGQEVFDARFTSNTSSYRAYKFPWSGQPTTPPAIALAPNNDGTTELWSSWNGATAVSSWRVLRGDLPPRRSLPWEAVPVTGLRPRCGYGAGRPTSRCRRSASPETCLPPRRWRAARLTLPCTVAARSSSRGGHGRGARQLPCAPAMQDHDDRLRGTNANRKYPPRGSRRERRRDCRTSRSCPPAARCWRGHVVTGCPCR